MEVIFLFSKDAMSIENIPVYGNKYWKTPNIDELARKGTIFNRHYTTASSTSMAFSSMLTGKYPYEFTERYKYNHVSPNIHNDIFHQLQSRGYECHILWSKDYMTGAWPFVRTFGDESKTKIHVVEMHQPAGIYRRANEKLIRNDDLAKKTIQNIKDTLNSIDSNKKLFIWLHLPHVLKGRVSYGDDIDLVDELLGFVRHKYGDENIYFTADHGHMNMHKNISGYGFHVYELICRVPLITPRIKDITEVNFITSHVDLIDIIINKNIREREFVLVDTQYYAQPNRKIAIITNQHKYIYNKKEKSEELYDLLWDFEERYNLLELERFDNDKKIFRSIQELYFYPYHFETKKHYDYFKKIFISIWKKGTFLQEMECKSKDFLKRIKAKIKYRIQKKRYKK